MGSISNPYIIHSEYDTVWKTPAEKTVPEYLLRKLSQHVLHGRRHCVTSASMNKTVSYEELASYSKNIAGGLYNLGFKKGDTLIYLTNNNTLAHSLILGVWRANGTVRSSYCEEIQDALLERVIESKVKWIACDKEVVEEVLQTVFQVPWDIKTVVFGEYDGCIPLSSLMDGSGAASCPPLTILPSDIALIVPTSGTTGRSKGAMFSHQSLLQNILAFEYLPLTDRQEVASIVYSKPTHFIGSVVVFAYIAAGRHIIAMPSVTVESLLKAIQKYKARSLFCFPKYVKEIVNDPRTKNYDISSVEYLLSGGQIISPESVAIMKKFDNVKHFLNIYGMTECGLLTSSADWAALHRHEYKALDDLPPFSVGKLIPNSSLKVVDIDTGDIVGPGCKGELCFKMPLICDGYLNRPEDTNETFKDGWLYTGDVGYYDEKGYIYVVDRNKEIFRYFGDHISPSELESILIRHPSVADTICCGVPDPDGGDFVPRAFVVLKESKIGSTTIAQEIKDWFNRQVAVYKQLRGGLYVLKSLPVGKTGKVTRKLASELVV